MYRCPGQFDRNLRIKIYKCPHCRGEVEIFSDEVKTKCPSCGKVVVQEKLPSCIDWCSAARECLGEEKWKQLKKGRD